MLEATMAGAYPLVPNRLVYPEMYPAEFLYEDDSTLCKRLLSLCDDYSSGGDYIGIDKCSSSVL